MNMKSKITMALLALGVISSASAQNVVYLTGSSAFRSTVYNALHSSAGPGAGGVFDAAPTEVEFGGSGASGANYMLFFGKIGGTDTYIDCVWSGSEAGIASVCNVPLLNQDRDGNTIPLAGSPATWLKADGSITMNGWTASAPTSGQLESSSHQADLAQADTSQAVSLTPRVINTTTDLKDYGKQGVVTFTWVKNVNTTPTAAWNSLLNITLPQVHSELALGSLPVAFFSGNVSQTNTQVYLVGRNKGSGTRANTLVDHNYGPTTKDVQQFSIGGGVNPGDPTTGLVLQYEAKNGYESGGGVAAALGIDGSCQQVDPFTGKTGWVAIGYLGCGDAVKSGLTVANNWLTLDGVQESNGAIIEGQYYFWGYEHLFGKHNISGYQDTVGNLIENAVIYNVNVTAPVLANHDGAIGLQYMHCDKASDVAFPARN
jgi:hypothetical protein